MVKMTCEEHDQMAASTQFITHTVGRMLGAMEVGFGREGEREEVCGSGRRPGRGCALDVHPVAGCAPSSWAGSPRVRSSPFCVC